MEYEVNIFCDDADEDYLSYEISLIADGGLYDTSKDSELSTLPWL